MTYRPAYILSYMLAAIVLFIYSDCAAQDNTGPASAKEIAVTFDDLPFASDEYDPRTQEMFSKKLVELLNKYKIPAIGFVNEGKLYNGTEIDQVKLGILRLWLKSGLELGNHTFSHIGLNDTGLSDFEADVIKGESVIRKLMNDYGKKPEFFRHPYLQTGKSLGKRDSFEVFLSSHGYRIAPVTVDNSDWIFARAYDKARSAGDKEIMTKVAEAYIPYMESKIEYYEQQSQQLFGRQIKQILLVHANPVNSDHFGKIAEMLLRRGYKFISIGEALNDSAYKSPDTFIKPGGISWIHRWAISKGFKRDFFKGEPVTPEFVMKQAGVDEE